MSVLLRQRCDVAARRLNASDPFREGARSREVFMSDVACSFQPARPSQANRVQTDRSGRSARIAATVYFDSRTAASISAQGIAGELSVVFEGANYDVVAIRKVDDRAPVAFDVEIAS